MQFRVVELFCGLGGLSAALGSRGSVVAAVDISRHALAVYARNWPGPVFAREIESLGADFYAGHNAHLWWLSPPCQPYTRRGRQRDLADPRAASLVAVLARAVELRPPAIVLENVPAFASSLARQLVTGQLAAAGYTLNEYVLCPTQWGWPQRRVRYYLTATLGAVSPLVVPAAKLRPLASFLDADPDPALGIVGGELDRFAGAVDYVDPQAPGAVASCFGASYGKSVVRAGSYLQEEGRIRRFSPEEIVRLLGFPERFSFPAGLTLRQRWQLAGNSLAVPVVAAVLETLNEAGAAGLRVLPNNLS